ncbi:MAG: type I restriction-modification system subunit M N-terminal domain-containing protein [Halofilum sp. (in: g-proteobacteria)]|nr:type I restriction-modification system subunit M N-terminal domain-containing protein [Halofilum sp. (in: g-proteobacteria)]
MVNGDVEKRLWAAADQLWANTGLKPAEFSTPVLGPIFLRYAEESTAAAEAKLGPVRVRWSPQGEQGRLPGGGRVIFLRRDWPVSRTCSRSPRASNIGKAINEAMKAIRGGEPAISRVPYLATTHTWRTGC